MEQFIIRLEWQPFFNKMTDVQRGIMISVFFDYHNGNELDFKEDVLVEALWLSMKPNIDRMNKKYQTSVENGKKGGRPRKTQTKPKETQTKPKETEDNLTDTLKEKEKEKENIKENIIEDITDNTGVEILKETISRNDFFEMLSELIRLGMNQDEATLLIKEEYEVIN